MKPITIKHSTSDDDTVIIINHNYLNNNSFSNENLNEENIMDRASKQQQKEKNDLSSIFEYFTGLIEIFFESLKNEDNLIKHIENTTKILSTNKTLDNLYHYNEVIRIYYILLKNSIEDSDLIIISSYLNEFFIEFQRNCMEWPIENNKYIVNKQEWIDLIDEMLNKLFNKLNGNQNDDTIITMTTVPIALQTLFVINVKFELFKNTNKILKIILLIIQNRQQRQLTLNNEYWSKLIINCDIYIKIFTAINYSDKFTDDEVKKFTSFLLNLGLGEDRFHRYLIQIAFKNFTRKLAKTKLNLFLLSQKEISQLLCEKLNENFDLDLLYVCIKFFDIKFLPGDLFCSIISVFICKCDTRIYSLLNHAGELSQISKKELISLYFEDIMIHLFFEFNANIKQIYDVFRFLTNYCHQNIFPLIIDRKKSLANSFLQCISKNRQITLQALSFLFLSSTSTEIHFSDSNNNFNYDWILKLNLGYFKDNDQKFRHYLQSKLISIYLHQIGRHLEKIKYEKSVSIKSFQIILKEYLESHIINFFRVKIFLIIQKLLLKDDDKLIPIELDILDCFIEKVDKKFVEHEILSIVLLLISTIKKFPEETVKLFKKLLTNFNFQTPIYYQLGAIMMETDLESQSIFDLINQRLNRFVPDKINIIDISVINPVSSTEQIALHLDSNNNNKIAEDFDPKNLHQDPDLLIPYLKSTQFASKCRGIYFLLHNLDMIDEKIQIIIFKQLYVRLNLDKSLFYQIYSKKLNENGVALESFLKDFIIDLKIPFNGCSTQISPETTTIRTTTTSSTETLRTTLSGFFRAIVLKVLECIKFSTSNEITILATNCLGVLGAIDYEFLNFIRPIQKNELEKYEINNGVISRQPLIDYCNQDLYQPKKKQFKLLILDILMNMVKSSTRNVDYNSASFALQEMLPLFSVPEEDNRTSQSSSSLTQLSTQQVESYVKRQYGRRRDNWTFSQEINQLEKCDQIKAYIKNEKQEFLDLNQDLTEELLNFRQIINQSHFGARDLKNHEQNEQYPMEAFFNNVKPTMSFNDFLQSFIHMLYHCFIIPHMKKSEKSNRKDDNSSNNSSGDSSDDSSSQSLIFNLLSSAVLQQSTSGNCINNQSHEAFLQEFKQIKMRIDHLKTPEKIFIVCYHMITKVFKKSKKQNNNNSNENVRNPKLSYTLVPCLLIFSLRYGSDEMREKFAQYFKSMIQTKFIQQPLMFMTELGQIGGELLCNIYDYLVNWYQTRKLAHSVIFDSSRSSHKNIIDHVDKEFHGIKLILESIDLITIAQLAYHSRSYTKALQYLEQFHNKEQIIKLDEQDLKIAVKKLIETHERSFLKIYQSLNDLDSIKGLLILNGKSIPSIDHGFHEHYLNKDSIDQLICGSQLFSMNYNHQEEEEKKAYFYDVQHKYFDTLKNLNQHLPPQLIFNNNNNSRNGEEYCDDYLFLQHHLVDATWKLNNWDLINNNNNNNVSSFNYSITNQVDTVITPNFGYILSAIQQDNEKMILNDRLINVQQCFMAQLNASMLTNTLTAYSRSYEASLIPIQIIYDIQQFISTINSFGGFLSKDKLLTSFQELINGWTTRNNLIPYGSFKKQILDVQRSMIQLSILKYSIISPNLTNELFRYWHESLKCSMNDGCIDQAYVSLVKAIPIRKLLIEQTEKKIITTNPITNNEQVDFILDEAQLFWFKNKPQTSIQILRAELEKNYSEIQQYCYIEIVKNFCRLSDKDLNGLKNSLGLKLTKSDIIPKLPTDSSSFKFSQLSARMPSSSSMMNRNNFEQSTQLSSFDQEMLVNYGRLQLRFAEYCESAQLFNSYAMIVLYKAVTVSCPKWEEAHFQLAMFFRRLYMEYQNSNQILANKNGFIIGKRDEITDLKVRVIKSLCESLKFGTLKFVRLSLPILLNIWIDLGYEYLGNRRNLQNRDNNFHQNQFMDQILKKSADKSTLLIGEMFSTVNNVIFFNELDILISHMLHQFEPIAKMIGEILAKLIADFPHHMCWQLSRSINSSLQRSCKVKEIIHMAQKSMGRNSAEIINYFQSFNIFSQCLRDLADYKPNKPISNEIALHRTAPRLLRSLESEHKFSMPSNGLPNMLNIERLSQKKKDYHFSPSLFIEKIENQAVMMKSLQKPKKITLILNNGIKRDILVKSGDNLRRDQAMLNFCNTYNQCYRGEIPIKSIEPMSKIESKFDLSTEIKIWSRRRQQPLIVQTYFVVPLSESFGIIEWIPGLIPFKTLVEDLYMNSPAKKKMYLKAKNDFLNNFRNPILSREKRIERFLLNYPNFQPPVFQNWFFENYVDSYSWYVARRNFIRTTAAFSMLGYIFGLCDRHTDNILLDPATGQVVHVDYNCIFNMGEDFTIPECVPFRLTHNMISAMGVQGYEGLFRYTCEDVLLVMKQFRELFMNSITIFLYDVLDRIDDNQFNKENLEKTKQAIFNVEARLIGLTLRTINKLPKGNIMSISGQVDHAIKEATDLNNLGSMYYGWASYL